MDFHKGDKVIHADDPDAHGVGTVVEVHGQGDEVRYRVAWPMMEGRLSADVESPAALRPAPVDQA